MPTQQPRASPGPRDRLLAVAVELFAKHGIERINSNQIARDAGVGVGTFYAHFHNKQELVQCVVVEALDELRRDLEATGANAEEDVERQVRLLVETIVRFGEREPARFRLAFGREAAGPGRPAVAYSTRAAERRLAELQRVGMLDAALHPGVAAKAFVTMQMGVVAWWLEETRRAPREALVETLVRLHPALAGRPR